MEPLFQTISTIIRPVAISRRAIEPLFQTIFYYHQASRRATEPVAYHQVSRRAVKPVAEHRASRRAIKPVAECTASRRAIKPVAEAASCRVPEPVAKGQNQDYINRNPYLWDLSTPLTPEISIFNIRLRETLDTGEPPKEEFHLEEERWTVHDSRTRLYDDLSMNSPTKFTFPSTASSDFFASSYHTLRVTSTGTQLISTDRRHSHIKARSTTPCEKTAE